MGANVLKPKRITLWTFKIYLCWHLLNNTRVLSISALQSVSFQRMMTAVRQTWPALLSVVLPSVQSSSLFGQNWTNAPSILYFGQYLTQFETTYLLKPRIHGIPKYSRLSYVCHLESLGLFWNTTLQPKHAFSLVESWISWHHKCPNLSGYSGLVTVTKAPFRSKLE